MTPAYIGKLRTILHSNEWDRRFGLGNPAADKSVKDYLRLVTAEQLQARVTPKQATTFFVDKLTQLCSNLDRKLQDNKAINHCIIARDQTYFKVAFFCGDRPRGSSPSQGVGNFAAVELVLTLNNFSFDGEHYQQIGGVAMGTKMGPSYSIVCCRLC